MHLLKKYYTVLFFIALLPTLASAGAADSTWIRFDGTLKTKFEWSPKIGEFRFNLRNSRAGFRGGIGLYVDYRVQVELNAEGKFTVLDGFATIKPTKNFNIFFGQTAVPFENLYLITPSEMMFANRPFIGKFFSPGSRDLGGSILYKINTAFPLAVEAGVFNGAAINDPHWTDNPSYAFRLTAGSMNHFKTSAKVYRYPRRDWLLTGADISYRKNNFLLQAEVMNRHNYNDTVASVAKNFTGAYVQSSYTVPYDFWKMFHCLIPAVRWDAMGYNVTGDGIGVNRMTFSVAAGLNMKPFTSFIRLDYEHYFLHNEIPDLSSIDKHVTGNKFTIELLLKF